MTKQQAITKLITTRELTTDLLKPLGIAFESFLMLAQRSDADVIVEKLVKQYEKQSS